VADPALCAIARSPGYRAAFHDITSGNNTVKFGPKAFHGYSATPGWDAVTGLSSPDARVLIPLLARYARPCSWWFRRLSRGKQPPGYVKPNSLRSPQWTDGAVTGEFAHSLR
jgi:hypothetical protein